MNLTPLRAAGLIAAIVFAVMTIRALPAGQDRQRRPAAAVRGVRAAAAAAVGHPGAGGDVLNGFSFKRGGGGQILGATVLAVGILYLFAFSLGRPQRARAPRRHPADREPGAGAVRDDRPPRAVRRRHRGGDPGLQRVREHRPRAGQAAGACAVCRCTRSSSTTAPPTGRPRCARGRRCGGAAAAQPRPGGGAADRLPAGARHRRRDRGHDGRRRPAPAGRAVPPGGADRARRGRRGRRLPGARRRRPQPRRPRAGHQAVRPAAIAADLEPGHRPRLRLPRRAHVGAARARVPAGPVPQLRVHRRGVQEAPEVDRGAGDDQQPDLGHRKKPAHFRYGMGFANALVRAWLR